MLTKIKWNKGFNFKLIPDWVSTALFFAKKWTVSQILIADLNDFWLKTYF